LPAQFDLGQNYPNPFNPTTQIRSASASGGVIIEMYNILGQLVQTIAQGQYEAGHHHVEFDAHNLGRGVYLYRMTKGSFTAVRKLVVLKKIRCGYAVWRSISCTEYPNYHLGCSCEEAPVKIPAFALASFGVADGHVDSQELILCWARIDGSKKETWHHSCVMHEQR
jgi:hypothetical protein